MTSRKFVLKFKACTIHYAPTPMGTVPLKAGTILGKYEPELKPPDNLELRPPKPNFIHILEIVSR
jgi:hypothetical protein